MEIWKPALMLWLFTYLPARATRLKMKIDIRGCKIGGI